MAVNQTTLEFTTTGGAVPVYRFTPASSNCLVINLHGSGFVNPYADRDVRFATRLSEAAHATIYDVDYPLAPAQPFPAALTACDEIFQSLRNQYPETPLILLGHSAGGNLAIGTQILAQRQQRAKAQLVILDYPALDLDTDPRDKPFPTGARDVISPETALAYNAAYVPNGEKGNPLVSPVTAQSADLAGFPPTVIATADHDSLMTEGEAFGRLLIAAGTPVTMHRYPNSLHGFTVGGTGAATAAFADIVTQITQCPAVN